MEGLSSSPIPWSESVSPSPSLAVEHDKTKRGSFSKCAGTKISIETGGNNQSRSIPMRIVVHDMSVQRKRWRCEEHSDTSGPGQTAGLLASDGSPDGVHILAAVIS